jgi:hypothetical protein
MCVRGLCGCVWTTPPHGLSIPYFSAFNAIPAKAINEVGSHDLAHSDLSPPCDFLNLCPNLGRKFHANQIIELLFRHFADLLLFYYFVTLIF